MLRGEPSRQRAVSERDRLLQALALERGGVRLQREQHERAGIGGSVTTAQAEVSRDGTIALVRVPLDVPNSGAVPLSTGERLIELVDEASAGALRVEAAGPAVAQAQQGEVSSEGIGLIVARSSCC